MGLLNPSTDESQPLNWFNFPASTVKLVTVNKPLFNIHPDFQRKREGEGEREGEREREGMREEREVERERSDLLLVSFPAPPVRKLSLSIWLNAALQKNSI